MIYVLYERKYYKKNLEKYINLNKRSTLYIINNNQY